MSVRSFALSCAILFARVFDAGAEEKKADLPKVTACAPLEITPGATATVRLRGLQLDTASELRFVPAGPDIKAELKEKKKTEVPNGLDAKDVGDTQLEVVLTVPAATALGALKFQVKTAGGWTAERELRVLDPQNLIDEKESNGGFREAQNFEREKTLRGVIKEDKDVDVFALEAQAGEHLEARVYAAQGASLLDPLLTLFDARGQLICSADDSPNGHDPIVKMTAPATGKYFLSVQDANDRGGTFYAYELTWKIAP